jgi:hypothetical protein
MMMVFARSTLLAVTCFVAGTGSATADCRIDPSQALSWSQFATLTPAVEPPSMSTYEGCGRRLVYVAAVHSNDPTGKTFTLVRTAFEKTKPQFVVLEGFEESMGSSPAALVAHSAKVAGTPGDAEPYLSVRLAQATGVPFIGGEPEDSDILAEVRTKGMTARDMFATYVLRQIEQWVRETKLASHTDPKLDALIRDYAKPFARDAKIPVTEISDIATADAFKAWYKATNGVAFDTGYKPQDAWPITPESNRPTNRLIVFIPDARDKHILGVINRSLETKPVVLVVYGASHLDIEAPALEAAFGKPAVAH